MRKVLYVAVILVPILMLAFAAPALAAEKGKKEKPPKPAKLEIDPKKIDFGKAMGGESKDATVNVSNKGEAEAKDVKCVPGGAMGKWVTLNPDMITVTGGKDAKPVEVKLTLKPEPQEVKKDKKGKEVPGKEEKKAGNIECKYGEGKKLNIPIMFVHVPGKKEEVKKEEPKKEEPKPEEKK